LERFYGSQTEFVCAVRATRRSWTYAGMTWRAWLSRCPRVSVIIVLSIGSMLFLLVLDLFSSFEDTDVVLYIYIYVYTFRWTEKRIRIKVRRTRARGVTRTPRKRCLTTNVRDKYRSITVTTTCALLVPYDNGTTVRFTCLSFGLLTCRRGTERVLARRGVKTPKRRLSRNVRSWTHSTTRACAVAGYFSSSTVVREEKSIVHHTELCITWCRILLKFPIDNFLCFSSANVDEPNRSFTLFRTDFTTIYTATDNSYVLIFFMVWKIQ